jgi:hypothetical protein
MAALLSLIFPAAGAPAQQRAGVAAEKYEIDAQLEPQRGFLRARAGVTLRARGPLRAVVFELNYHLKILQITDEQGRALEWARSGRLGSHSLGVTLAEPLAADSGTERLKLTFAYEGVLPAGELDYITKGGVLLRDESRWYPSTDLAAFTAHRMRVTLPPRWMALTAGDITGGSDTQADWESNPQTFLFETRRPVSSRALFAAPGRYAAVVGTVFGARPRGRDVFALAGEAQLIRDWYAKLFDPDADLRDATVRVVQGFSGARGALGYSAPGFVVVSEDVVKYAASPGWAPEFLPHEMTHQWLPIEVTLERPEDGWLAESAAEYLAWRFLLEKSPEQARLMVQRAMRDALEHQPLPSLAPGLRLFGIYGRDVAHKTLYQRGMLVWRTLETVIGRSRVDAALREYFRRFRGRSAGIAGFRTICEEISGRSLGWFFDYFLSGTEIPELKLRRLDSRAPNEYLGEIIFENVPAEFQARVEMRFSTPAGVVENSVAASGRVTPFSMNLPAPAARAVLDPDLRILRWTDAARRNLEQAKWLAARAAREDFSSGLPRAALRITLRALEQAIALDPGDAAFHHQRLWFEVARRRFLLGELDAAAAAFQRVLELPSLDSADADFRRAWAHLFRARIEQSRGRTAAARAEAAATLKLPEPALDTPVAWPEAKGAERTARQELARFAARPSRQN